MRLHLILGVIGSAALCAGSGARAQLANPISEPISKQGLNVEIGYLARLPDSRGLHPASEDVAPNAWARVSYVRDLPDGRRFSNDSRGLLYLLDDDNNPSLYLSLAALFPGGAYGGLQSGFIGFDFHPNFVRNGLFYTVHGEKAENNSGTLDFIPPSYTLDDVTYHNVIIEWRATDPAADVFAGTRRELLRVGHVVDRFFHPFGHLGFNPASEPGDADYGLLYTSGSDLGFSNGGGPNAINPAQLQRLDSVVGAILRIDPRSPTETGGTKGLGDYTIPVTNPYALDDDSETLGEIYAHGLRNAHRLSWDLADGTMFAADIGMSQIEEINIIHAGHNYGWMQREGIYDNAVNVENGDLAQVYALSDDILSGQTVDGFTYPVAMYDHDEGIAVTAGFAYRGSVPALQGKFVFGDIQRGRLFATDLAEMKAADDGVPQTVAAVEEIQLFTRDDDGNPTNVTFWELVEEALGREIARADLHISESRNGELFLTSRQDGIIRMLVGAQE